MLSAGATAHAPLLKLLAIATTGATVVALASGTTAALAFDARRALTDAPHLARSLAVLAGPATLVCARAVSLLLALALLYRVRAVERFLGSAKLAVALALALAAHAVLALAAAALLAHRAADDAAPRALTSSGPACVTTALLVLHARLVPALHHARVCGVRVSEKALDAALWLNLVAAEWPRAALGVAAGLLAGWLFAADVGRVAQCRLPRALTAACAALFLPFLDPHTPAPFMTRDGLLNVDRVVPVNQNQQQQQQQQRRPQQQQAVDIEAFRAAAAAAGDIFAASDLPPGAQTQAHVPEDEDDGVAVGDAQQGVFEGAVVEPDPEAVGLCSEMCCTCRCRALWSLGCCCASCFTDVLVAMGIDERVARETLAACDNNVSIAVNRILDASS